MSTRANIILKESYKDAYGNKKSEELYFYRHSDGYPDGTLPSLNLFCQWIKDKKIRNNLTQAAGWLIVIGAMEYNTIPKYKTKKSGISLEYGDLTTVEKEKDNGSTWKVGAFEPTMGIHGDIQYLYTVDVVKGEVSYKEM